MLLDILVIEVGLTLLHEGTSESHINNIFSVLILLFYYNYLSITFSVEKNHSSAVEESLPNLPSEFPNCAILKFFHGRFSMLKGYFKHAS